MFKTNTITIIIGIASDHIFSQVSPTGKATVVEKIKEKNPKQVVLFVGDGVNDSPALAKVLFVCFLSFLICLFRLFIYAIILCNIDDLKSLFVN